MSIRIYQELSENEEEWICSKCKDASKKKTKLKISEASNTKMNTLEKIDEKSPKNIVRNLLSDFFFSNDIYFLQTNLFILIFD